MAAAATTGTSATHTERQVLSGFQTLIAMKTPFRAKIPTGPKPMVTTPEWECRTYHDAQKTGYIEGQIPAAADAQNNLSTKTILKGRFIKQLRHVAVTKEMKLMGNQYNEGDPLGANIKQATEELYVDVESAIASDDEAVVPAAGATASVSRGIFRWLSNADGRMTETTTRPDSAYRTPAAHIVVSKATADDVTEVEVRGLITQVAKSRKDDGLRFLGVCTPEMRDRFDDFSRTHTGATTSDREDQAVYRFAQQQGTINREITLYKSSNGRIELMTCHRLDSTVHFGLLTPEHLMLGYAQGVTVNPESSPSAQINMREIDVIYVTMPGCLNSHGKIITGATA